jgi:hypothetical protein
LIKVALLLAVAIFIGWLCVRAAALEVFSRNNPAVVAALAPNDPRVTTGLAGIEFGLRNGAVTPATTRRVAETLKDLPLGHDPFFFAGLGRLVGGDERAALPLIREARRRNPRSRMARLVYLDQVLRAGQVEEAAIEIAALTRLVPEAGRVLVPELGKYAVDPRTAPALIQALRPDPKLRNAVLEQLARSGADPEAVLRLAASGPPSPESEGVLDWQRLLLTALIEKGQVARARGLWSQFSGVGAEQSRQSVYDGGFRGLAGPAPFNWQFTESSAGVAELTKAPALQVEYYGRAEAELAGQLLQLGPGRHALSLAAAGNAPKSGGGIAWVLTCLGSKAPIATLPIANLTYAPKRLAASFAVPANCPAQWLRLIGTPAEFPAAHSITLSDLRIDKAATS